MITAVVVHATFLIVGAVLVLAACGAFRSNR